MEISSLKYLDKALLNGERWDYTQDFVGILWEVFVGNLWGKWWIESNSNFSNFTTIYLAVKWNLILRDKLHFVSKISTKVNI